VCRRARHDARIVADRSQLDDGIYPARVDFGSCQIAARERIRGPFRSDWLERIAFGEPPNLLHWTLPMLHVADSGGDDQRLAERMRVCQAVRAPGSKVTVPPLIRASPVPLNRESTRTAPVKFSGDPAVEGCDPTRVTTTSVSAWAGSAMASMAAARIAGFMGGSVRL
jgi:hypothetical protein